MSARRKLACVLFTDIQGYTERMHASEELGMALVRRHNAIMDRAARESGGVVIKTIGDAYLIEFSSAVDGVRCGLAAQEAFAAHNRERAEDGRLLVRISIHLGEVVSDEGDIFGDAVNLASRLQGATPPGRVCVTRQVYEQVRGKLACDFAPLGVRYFKGIPDPVEVIQILPKGSPLAALSMEGHALKTRACPGCGSRNPIGALRCRLCGVHVRREASGPVEPGVARPWTKTLEELPSAPMLQGVLVAIAACMWLAGPALLTLLRPLELLNYFLHLGGHMIFGLAGSPFLAGLGAAATQLAFPAASFYHSLRERQYWTADAALFWLAESLMGLGASASGRRAGAWALPACQAVDWTAWPDGSPLGTMVYGAGCLLAALALLGAFLRLRRENST